MTSVAQGVGIAAQTVPGYNPRVSH